MSDPYRNQQYAQPSQPGYPTGYQPQPEGSAPNYRWFVPGEGIRRDVIQADIQRYLGPEALVKPGHNTEGIAGYWIAAYRTLTPSMIADLRADSTNFQDSGARVSYETSEVHRSRHYWGPTGAAQAQSVAQVQQPQMYAQPVQAQQSYQNVPTPHGSSYAYQNQQPQTQQQQPQQYQMSPAQLPYQATTPAQNPPQGSPTYTNYTHTPSSARHPSADTQAYPTHFTGNGNGNRDTPRTHQPQPSQQSNQQHQQSQSYTNPNPSNPPSQITPVAPPGPPPGFYLASDGNYYPNSTLRRGGQ